MSKDRIRHWLQTSKPEPIVGSWLPEFIEEGELEPEWLVENFFPTGMSTISGAPKWGYKTTWATLNMMSVALGKELVEGLKPVKEAPVVFFDQEGQRAGVAKTFKYMMNNFGLEPKQFKDRLLILSRRNVKLNDRDWLKHIYDTCRVVGAELAVFDPFGRCLEGSENDADVVNKAMDYVNIIRDVCPSVALLHHLSGKRLGRVADPDMVDEVLRGSSALYGAYDSHMAMRDGPRKRKGNVTLIVRLKYGNEKYYELDWQFPQENAKEKKINLTMRELDYDWESKKFTPIEETRSGAGLEEVERVPGEYLDCVQSEMQRRMGRPSTRSNRRNISNL